MRKVAIITDSIASLPPQTIQRYGIQILPIIVSFNGTDYRDGIDISNAEAYRMLAEKPDQFFTSPASVGEYLSVFKKTSLEAESILCITLSSHLSGMFNLALLAVKQAREEELNLPIEVLDSQNATVGEGLIVTAACRAADEEKNLAEVLERARFVQQKVRLIGIMETIKNVYRTGRIPRAAAKFGSLLNIHPVFTISGGSVHITGITKNQKSGLNSIMRQLRAQVRDNPVHVAIAHANVPEAGEILKERVRREFHCVELWMTDFSPVMAYATGTGVLAAAYYCDTLEPVVELSILPAASKTAPSFQATP